MICENCQMEGGLMCHSVWCEEGHIALRAEVERLRAQIARMEQTARDDQAHRDFLNGIPG